jgi:hypothetical protein
MPHIHRAALVSLLLAGAACGKPEAKQDAAPEEDAGVEPVEPTCDRFEPLREPFFGDLHVHTALSLDANLQGTRLRPVEAYRFARGEEVGLPPYDAEGKPLRKLALERPLDFVALSDHAEFLGLVNTCVTEGSPGYDAAACKQYRDDPDFAFFGLNAGVARPQGEATYLTPCREDNDFCGAAARAAWKEVQDAAAAQNDAKGCGFTTFVAYEWSASPGLYNLHRNVIFANATVPALPFSYFDGNQEEELWSALERDCTGKAGGCDALTIPHNSNLSAGLMFEPVDRAGKPIDRAYAEKRAAFEPLVEIIQHKGSSECVPELGNDEQCNFELLPFGSLQATAVGSPEQELKPSDFVRHALGQGLLLEQRLGVDPFRYGFVGGTDTHLAIPGAVDERTFQGHGGAGSSARTRLPTGLTDNYWLNPGGLTVLWSEENSRSALFRAMKRREAYATSGPRIVLRFFGGFDYAAELCGDRDFVATGYRSGVPMGGELEAGADGQKPRFLVWALRDSGTSRSPGVQLERIQIIKGWVQGGEVKYAVHDVVDSGKSGAGVGPDCAPRGEGADELCKVWEDASYAPDQPAFYYARVLENPTCRWSAHLCRAASIDCSVEPIAEGYEGCCKGEPETQQERAWSSPIFVHARTP